MDETRPTARDVVAKCHRHDVHLTLQPCGELRIQIGRGDPSKRNGALGWLDMQLATYPTLRSELVAFLTLSTQTLYAQRRVCVCCRHIFYAEPVARCFDCRTATKAAKPEGEGNG